MQWREGAEGNEQKNNKERDNVRVYVSVWVNVWSGLCWALSFFSCADTFQNTCPHRSPLIAIGRAALKLPSVTISMPLHCNLHTLDIATQKCSDPIVVVELVRNVTHLITPGYNNWILCVLSSSKSNLEVVMLALWLKTLQYQHDPARLLIRPKKGVKR